MLSSGWPNTTIEAVEGPCVKKNSVQSKSGKCTLMRKQTKKVRNKRKIKKRMNTMFMVNLPLNNGEILLERTSLSAETLLESSAPVSSDFDSVLESETLDCEFECDTASHGVDHAGDGSQLQTSQPQQTLYQGDVCTSEFASEGNATFSDFRDLDDYVNDNEGFNQSGDITQTENHAAHGEWRYNQCHHYPEHSSNGSYRNWENEDVLTTSQGVFPVVPNPENWAFPNSYYMQQDGGSEQLAGSASMIKGGAGMEGLRLKRDVDMSFSAVQPHDQQQPQHQQMAWSDGSLQTGSMWEHRGMSGEVASYLSAARINMEAPCKDALVHSGSISQELRKQFHPTDLRQLQTCSNFNMSHSQTGPTNYMTQFTSYPTSQVNHRLMTYAGYDAAPKTNPEQHFAYPVSSKSGWSATQTDVFVQPGQAMYYRACSDISDLMSPWNETMLHKLPHN